MVLVLFLFWTCVCGLPLFEEEEGQSITLRWDCPRPLNLSALTINCYFIKAAPKTVLHVVKGEVGSVNEQFSGRVMLDRAGLGQGRVQIVLSRLTALDSGEYSCDMYAAKSGRWRFVFYEHFEIDVVRSKSTPKVTTVPLDDVTTEPEHSKIGAIVITFVISFPIGVIFGVLMHAAGLPKCRPDDKKSQQTKDKLTAVLSSDDAQQPSFSQMLEELNPDSIVACSR